MALCAILALVGAACAGPTTDTTSASGSTTPGGGDVPNPDVLVVTVNDDVFNLDPAAVNGNDVGMDVILNTYDRLVFIAAEDGSVIPQLATEVPSIENGLISEDGLTYTFPIREGVTFSDGTDLTAEDVKYSWDRVVEMNLPEGQAPLFENVAETTVVDDFTFEVTLNEVDASFLAFLAAHPVAAGVSQDAVEENGGVVAGQPNEFMAQNTVGSGPYVLASWERGDRMSFDINEDYWGEPAHLPVRWELIVDSPATGLQAKEYDIVDISPTDVPSIEPIPHAVVDTSILDLQVLQIGMNMNICEGCLPEPTPSHSTSSRTSGCGRRSTTPSTTRATSTGSWAASAGGAASSSRWRCTGTTRRRRSTRPTRHAPRSSSVRPATGTRGSPSRSPATRPTRGSRAPR
jgi:peptide/nickel transport system substrate-binding protein